MNKILSSGVDIVEIQRFRDLNPLIRERFFCRVFTPDERAEIGYNLERAAGYFAAKEAMAKALGCGIGPVSWQEIEIIKDPQGKPEVRLLGNARDSSTRVGIFEWSLSISHTRQNAIAMVVGVMEK